MKITFVTLILVFIGSVASAEKILSSDEAAGRFGQVNGHRFSDINYTCQYVDSFSQGTKMVPRSSPALLSFKIRSNRAVFSLEAVVGFDYQYSMIRENGSGKILIGENGNELLILNASRVGNESMNGVFLAARGARIDCRKLNTIVVRSGVIAIDGVLIEASDWPTESK